ncbi:poly [Carex littledalei]|uniref:Poly [ADP-ribose] polymerase n=1 Tax=Carex littledalei TaxID=544730 RepID=A0A833VU33_9POAL|nr:poly [Carex littledalei]
MASPPKPWKAEYAKSARSSCKTCKSAIGKDQFRLGKMVVASQFDGFMPMWNHASCVLKKKNQIKALGDVEGIDLLRWEDQEKIRKYIDDDSSGASSVPAGASSSSSVSNDDCAIDVSPSSRASCKKCNEKIQKGTIRVSTKREGKGAKGLQWYHVNCFIEMLPSTDIKNVFGWDKLDPEEKENILSLLKKKSTVNEEDEKKDSKGTKRKKGVSDEKPTAKAPKLEETSSWKVDASKSGLSDSDLEKKLKEQNELLWSIKDELKKNVSTAEMREMLEENDQGSSGSEYDLRDRCADGMLFGALGPCPICSGSIRYAGGQYKCHGYASAWSKCSYSTTDAVRLKGKWKIPEGTTNKFLLKWFKSQKVKKPSRVLPPRAPCSSVVNHPNTQSSVAEGLNKLKVALLAKSDEDIEDWKQKVNAAGASFHANVKKDTSCLVVCGELPDEDLEIKRARRMKVPIVREEYLEECLRKKQKLPFDMYKVESALEASKGVVTVKVKGRSAVHEASGLQDTGHILEVGKSIYNTTLNMSDLSTGINSCYILQIIQEDKGSDCYVFRKWGRVGNEKIGGTKLEEMQKDDAIQEFRRLFLEKTGNPWEAWEQKKNFEKQPGRFFPLDIDYGVKQAPKKKDLSTSKSSLPPQLVELMKMLFNVETYKAALMEFEINMTEMPLGKLSKQNIQKGFEALTEIQNLLSDNSNNDTAIKESMLVAASNRFFTLIPSIHPHIIRDELDFKTKVKMLEALQDIEIASRIVGFGGDDDESLDSKYEKLKCLINPLPHDSDDYRLVENYLLNTHAPTHKDWSLELEEVFALEREGETDKYASYRNKLQNKMLLWHGSRLTNFVGILSQGLRIAPPEAPATGYMFGKGVYFADLVSKSAQYCFVDRKDPVGLMLLSEVALGEMYQLRGAKYLDKLPKGKHSTKGLGKTVPLESEFVNWRDEVVVPCGEDAVLAQGQVSS